MAVASTPYGGPPPVPSTIPSQPPEQIVCGKTKGKPWRHEIIRNGEHPAHRRALTWHGESVYQVKLADKICKREGIFDNLLRIHLN